MGTLQGYFPNEQLPKCAISQVCPAAALGPALLSHSAQPHFSLRHLRRPNQTVSAWKFHILKIATWKVTSGKMSFRKYLTLIFLRKTIEHIYVPDIQHCFHIYFGKLSKSDRQCLKMGLQRLVIYPLLESKCVNNAY